MNTLQYFVALSPVLLVLVLLVILRLPAIKSMPLSWIIHASLAFFIWKVPLQQITASSIEGIIIAASILWILFCAILLLIVLRISGALETISSLFTSISADRRVQVILIAWLFQAFLEGGSGFGSPAAICAPLLVGLGFPPLAAVVLSLISNSFPVIYGSVGTTIFVGLAQGLQQGGDLAPMVANYLGNSSLMDYLQLVSVKSAVLMWLPAALIPLFLSSMLTRFWGENKSWKEGLGIWKFALLTGVTYSSFTLIIAVILGPEFPTILGSMLTLVVMVIVARKKIFLPQIPWSFTPSNSVQPGKITQLKNIPTWKALTPYLLATFILLVTRLDFLPFMQWLNFSKVGWSNILGTEISTHFAPFYSPGAIFTFTALISVFILKLGTKQFVEAFKISSLTLTESLVALATAIPMVRIFINSGVNSIQIGSMPVELASSMAATLGSIWPLVAPFVGALGAFISGSATISNIMFSLFQFGAALENQIDPAIINALQTVGATVGKMICVVSVVAASSVVNLQGNEGKIIRYTLIPSLLICLMVGLIAFVML